MTIGNVNYPHPVQVNGYECRNCTDVDNAKKRIDPQHPQSGPNDINAATDPTRKDSDPVKIEAAKKAAEANGKQVTGYSPSGPNTAHADKGRVLSLSA